MGVEEHRRYSPGTLGWARLTVSDSRGGPGGGDDASGRRIGELVEAAGHRVVAAEAVPDEMPAIRAAVRGFLATAGVDVVVTTGGTGFSPRDVTFEALAPLFDREVPGFGELFRWLSWEQVGAAAMLSRAGAGVVGGRAVFALPGSPKAVELAMSRLVIPEAAHLVGQLRRG